MPDERRFLEPRLMGVLLHLSYLVLWCYWVLLGVGSLRFDNFFWQIFFWQILLTNFLDKFVWKIVWRYSFDDLFDDFCFKKFLTNFLTNLFYKFFDIFLTNSMLSMYLSQSSTYCAGGMAANPLWKQTLNSRKLLRSCVLPLWPLYHPLWPKFLDFIQKLPGIFWLLNHFEDLIQII